MYFAIHVTQKLTHLSNTKYINFCFGSIVFSAALIASDFSKYNIFIEKIFKPTSSIFLFVANVAILIFANIKQKIKKAERIPNENSV